MYIAKTKAKRKQKQSPRPRPVGVDLDDPDPSNWTEVIPEAPETLRFVSLLGGETIPPHSFGFVLCYVHAGFVPHPETELDTPVPCIRTRTVLGAGNLRNAVRVKRFKVGLAKT